MPTEQQQTLNPTLIAEKGTLVVKVPLADGWRRDQTHSLAQLLQNRTDHALITVDGVIHIHWEEQVAGVKSRWAIVEFFPAQGRGMPCSARVEIAESGTVGKIESPTDLRAPFTVGRAVSLISKQTDRGYVTVPVAFENGFTKHRLDKLEVGKHKELGIEKIQIDADSFEVLWGGRRWKIVTKGSSCVVTEIEPKVRETALPSITEQFAIGTVATISEVIDPVTARIDSGSGGLVVTTNYIEGGVKVGDTVAIDSQALRVVRNLGRPKSVQQRRGTKRVNFDQIGGQDEAVRQIRGLVEDPTTHGKIMREFGKKPIKGALLIGPPGNGKTMLGAAAATRIAELNNAPDDDLPFFLVQGAEFLNKWNGVQEANIRAWFAEMRDYMKRTGIPVVGFLDEADALLQVRGRRGGDGYNPADTIVPTFLVEWDGLEEFGGCLILATNRPEQLDPAILRAGRTDRKIYVGRPKGPGRAQILRIHLNGKKLADLASLEALVDLVISEIDSDRYPLYRLFVQTGNSREEKSFHLRHIVSGAMLAGFVERALDFAIQRAKNGDGALGLIKDDLLKAVQATYEEELLLNHEGDLADVSKRLNGTLIEVEKVYAGNRGELDDIF